jgi:hypothetical protein
MSEWIEMPRIVRSEPVTTHSFFHLALCGVSCISSFFSFCMKFVCFDKETTAIISLKCFRLESSNVVLYIHRPSIFGDPICVASTLSNQVFGFHFLYVNNTPVPNYLI